MNYTKKSFSTTMPGSKFSDRWDQTFGKKEPAPKAEYDKTLTAAVKRFARLEGEAVPEVSRPLRKTRLEPAVDPTGRSQGAPIGDLTITTTALEPYWECATCAARCSSAEALLEHRKQAH